MIPVIDLEASSLSDNSYPIEVGIFIPSDNGLYESYSWLIKPTENWLLNREWNEKSASVHNISKNEIIENGHLGYDICNKLNSLLLGTTIYSDAPDYDYKWLKILFDEWNIDMKFDLGHILYPEDKKLSEKLNKVSYSQFNKIKEKIVKDNNLILHRAGDDSIMLGLIMQKLLK